MKKSIFLSAVAIFGLGSTGSLFAQNESDALRYSQLQFGGTARVQGMAGAQTALGGDLSSLNGNPAGLGMYRRSDIGLSTGLSFGSMSTKFLGQSSVDNKDNFNIPSFGFVLTNYKGDDSEDDWRSFSFGVAFTRQAHLHNRINFSGVNSQNSINQALVNNYYFGDLAYNAYLINEDVDGQLVPVLDNTFFGEGGSVRQSERIFSKGAVKQLDISLGTNYRGKLFLGASLGISSVNYRQTRSYTEQNLSDSTALNSFAISDEFRTTGSGANLKLGAIVMPLNWLRIGVTIQTPTYYSLHDTYSSNVSASFSEDTVVFADGAHVALEDGRNPSSGFSGEFDYNLTTPFRASGGVAVFAGKYGFVSADVEYVNYTHARFNSENPDDDFTPTNQVIDKTYNSAINLRVGAEARYEIFRIRGGYARYGDPYAHSSVDQTRTYYTGGIGVKQERYYFDLAYIHSFFNSAYQSYTLPDQVTPGAETTNTYNTVMATFGVTF